MEMEVEIGSVNGVRFEVSARKHHITCDQPAENHGTDAGMTPPELLLASLGTCSAYYAAEYLRARNLDTRNLRVRVTATKEIKPARMSNFLISIAAPSCKDERQREGLLRATRNCLIHNTLLHVPGIEIELEQKEPAYAAASHR